jgi:dipeptidyl aminopeptidase/acylaminoacyl peptidase
MSARAWRHAILPAFCLTLALAAHAQDIQNASIHSRVATILDDLSQTSHIGDVALSPDGKTVAMVLAGTLTLQPVQSAATPAHPQTPSVCPNKQPASISSLSWSPDSTHLAVLAACGDENRVALVGIDSATPSARPTVHELATLHGYAKDLTYAHDGKHLGLLYVEGATRPSGALAAMTSPSGVIGVEGLEIQRVATVDTATGTLAQVTPPGLHVYEFDWSPDSARLAFVAAPPPGEDNWWVARLYTESVPAGAQTAATAAPQEILDPSSVDGPLHGLQIAIPRFSPDGSKIAFVGGLMSDQGATGGDLYLLPSQGGSPTNFTPGAPTSIQWFSWTPDQKILATVIDAGSERIDQMSFTFPPSFRAPGGTRVLTTNRLTSTTLARLPYSVGNGRLSGSISLSHDGATAAFSASSYSQAPEVYAGPIASASAITHLNTSQKPSWGKSESVDWTNENFHVQGWLLYPANYDPAKKYPMVVMVHGGPSGVVIPRWPGAGFGAAPIAAMGYFVFEPNPRGSYGEGEAFTQANRKDFGYGDLRDILAGVDTVEHQLPAIDDSRLGITGWSYGGFMTMFDITQTHRFKAAVAGAGIANWLSYYGENSIDQWMIPFFGASVYDDPAVYAKSSAINFITQVKTPTLIVVGDRDGECPAPQSFEFWHALKAQNIPTQLVVYSNEGHGFVDPNHRRDLIARAILWFDKYMQ